MKMMQLGGGAPGDLPITMTQNRQLGGHPGDLPITMLPRPSQGDTRLAALAAKLPLGVPGPFTAPAIVYGPGMRAIGDVVVPAPTLAIGDAEAPPHALTGSEPTDAPAGAFGLGAVASGTPKDNSKLTARERAEALWALWACMYL